MESKIPIFIRTDASVSIGTGHLMRMIALGQAWQAKGGEVFFLCADITPALEQRLASEDFHLFQIHASLGSKEDLMKTMQLISKTLKADSQNARVVLDGYHFGSNYQLGIKAAGFKLLVVDDYGSADFYHADLVVNQNINAREELYAKRDPRTKLLLGTNFAMLRKEFLAYKDWKRDIPPVGKKILVTLGGSDPDNVTLKVVEALLDFDMHIKVAVGGSNPHLIEIENFIKRRNDKLAFIEVIINTTDMPNLMAWADVAVVAGGSTSWEVVFMGLPALVFTFAENQKEIALAIDRHNLGVNLGWANKTTYNNLKIVLADFLSDRAKRLKILDSGKNLIDGMGCFRICENI